MYCTKQYPQKQLIPLLIFIILTLLFTSRDTRCESNQGKWVLHQRQTPQHDIMSIYAIPEGKIWVDTFHKQQHNFHIFDGIKWQKITYDSQLLGNNPPFICDEPGRLFFLLNGNLIVWYNGSFTEYNSGELVFPLVGAFSTDGILYLGSYNTTKGGIYMFDGNSITRIRDGRTRSLTVDNSGNLWATHIEPDNTAMSLIVLEKGVWTDRTDEIESVSKDLTVQTSVDGSVWVNNLGKYGIYKNGNWEFNDGGSAPMYLSFDNNGGVWGYGSSKLYRLGEDGNWYESLIMENGITNKPYFLANTSDSTVWTFDGDKVYKYSENDAESWVLIDSPYDLGSDYVTCIAYTDDGRLICGHGLRDVEFLESEKKGISILNDSTWNNYSESEGVRFKNAYEMVELPYGEIMIYADSGFSLFDGDTWDEPDSLYVYDENAMFHDGQSIMWIATEKNGLIEYDFESYYDIFYPPAEISFYIQLYNVFVNTYNNIAYVQNATGSILSYNITNSEWKLVISDDKEVKDFFVDDDEFVWAARENNLVIWTGEKWEPVISQDTKEEIVLKKARFIHIDEEGIIWASGYDNTGYYENGIWRRFPELSGTSSDAFASYEDGRIAFNAFDEDRNVFYGIFEYYPDQSSFVTEEKPKSFGITGNYPNPFNLSTVITFELYHPEKLNISIYNITGQHIKTITERSFPAGINRVTWDSKSDAGVPTASGIYFYRIKTENAVKTGKMLLLR